MSDAIREAFDLGKRFAAAYDAVDEAGMDRIEKEFAALQSQTALSANGGAAAGYTGSGSLDALKQGAEGHIFPSPAPAHPVPLYLSPTVKESLTVQSEPIGYADPDSLADYRAGDRLHIPVYRPDASADWQDGVPVYLHPAPPSVAVPSEVTPEMIEAAEQVDDLYLRGTPEVWADVFRAMLAAALLKEKE